jgi:5-methylcytosine-specific restriction protein A
MYPNKQTFTTVIRIILKTADAYGKTSCDINAKQLHKFIGGYPPPRNHNHRMPNCNSAMKDLMQEGDEILAQPEKGVGASLTIRYYLPRL